MIHSTDLSRHSASCMNLVSASTDSLQLCRTSFCKIGSECLLNALQHAHASYIHADVMYGRRFFRLRFRDDGIGISEDVIRAGHHSGHWGLPGMKERAQCLGARLHIWTAPGKGTEIEVRLPAAAAYDRQSYRVLLRSFLRKTL